MINSKQHSVTWHVDNLKISHVDPAINTQLIGSLVKIYGNKIIISRGKVNYYLGMDLDMSVEEVTGISIIKYLKKIQTTS